MQKFKRFIKTNLAPKAKIELSCSEGTLKAYFFYDCPEHIEKLADFARDYCLDFEIVKDTYARLTIPPTKLEVFLEGLG